MNCTLLINAISLLKSTALGEKYSILPCIKSIEYYAIPSNIQKQLKHYSPQMPVGAANIWQKNKPSQIYFDDNQHLGVLALQIAHEWKHIFDLTALLTQNKKRPQQLSTENWVDLEVSAFAFQRQIYNELKYKNEFIHFQLFIQQFKLPELIDGSLTIEQIKSLYNLNYSKGNQFLHGCQ